jgi:hypothetical protein
MQSTSNHNIVSAIAQQITLRLVGKDTIVVRFVDREQIPFSWSAIAQGLCQEQAFRDMWNQTWADIPFDFQWKPVPIHSTSATTQPFFAVLVPSTFRKADPSAYQEHLQKLEATDLVADFTNLSGDAHLIIPRATGNYAHIAAFCRLASQDLIHAFWTRVGEVTTSAISQVDSLWCNTHGHGVPWMHIRCDRSLKYTAFPPSGTIDDNSQALWYQSIYASAYPDYDAS